MYICAFGPAGEVTRDTGKLDNLVSSRERESFVCFDLVLFVLVCVCVCVSLRTYFIRLLHVRETHTTRSLAIQQLQVFNSPFDDMLQEMTRDGYSAEDFKVKNIGNVLAATKACLPRKTEKPCAANVVVFNFGFTEDEDIEYFESVKASTSSASLEDFSICRAISVVTEDEFDVLETRLFENKLTLRKIEYDNGSSLSDIFQK